jgi:hypothetical protein
MKAASRVVTAALCIPPACAGLTAADIDILVTTCSTHHPGEVVVMHATAPAFCVDSANLHPANLHPIAHRFAIQ